MTHVNELIERITEAVGSHQIDLAHNDRAQDADTCACGRLVDNWDEHWAVVAVGAIQGLYVPPPPGSDRDALPDHLRRLIAPFMRPYLSTYCETAAACAKAAEVHPYFAEELRSWEARQSCSCRLTRKQDMHKCISPYHRKPTS